MCARLFGATRYVAHPLNTSIAIFFQEKEYGSHNNIFFFLSFFFLLPDHTTFPGTLLINTLCWISHARTGSNEN